MTGWKPYAPTTVTTPLQEQSTMKPEVSVVPVPDADARLADLLATEGEDLRGCMRDGYTDDDVNGVLGQLGQTVGLTLICVWDYVDTWGPGGNSDFFVHAPDGQLHELTGDLWRWLNDHPNDPQAPAHPGSPRTWVGPSAGRTTDTCAWNDGRGNFAVENRGQQRPRLVTTRRTPAGVTIRRLLNLSTAH